MIKHNLKIFCFVLFYVLCVSFYLNYNVISQQNMRKWDKAELGSLLDKDGNVPHPKKPVMIKYWTVPIMPKGEEEFVKNKINEFKKLYPEVTIEYEVLTWEGQNEKYQAALLEGNLPDVMMQGICEGGPDKGGLPLNGWISQKDLDDFLPGLIEEFRYPGDNKFYGIPLLYTHNSCMYINTDMFEKAGIDWKPLQEKPWDRKEFVDICKKLTIDKNNDGKTDQYGFGFGALARNYEGMPMLTNIMWTLGGDIETPDFRSLKADTPQFREALQFLFDLMYTYKVTPETVLGQSVWDIQTWWYRGTFAIYQGGGTYVINETREYNKSLAPSEKDKQINFAVVLPIYEGHRMVKLGPGGVSCKNQDDEDKVFASVAFAKFLTSTEGCKRAVDVFMLPARKSSGNSFQNDKDMALAIKIAMEYGIETSSFHSVLTKNAFYEVFEKAFAPNIEAVLGKQKTLDKAVADIDKKINVILNNYKRRMQYK